MSITPGSSTSTSEYEISFKVETHNHPSAIEPFGGANTGVGGVIRDVLGVSAKPIAATDVLCFGPQDLPLDELPEGVLHPRRIQSGVVAGVQDYGNKIGIPTVNGAILYDPGYTANPLVFCGCVGIAPKDSHPRSPQPGDRVIVLGGRTGRDGLRGATFSSMTMDAQTGEVSGASVQIGDPITEKGLIEVVVRARDQRLYHAITDCGAGGLSSAVGEMSSRDRRGCGAAARALEIPRPGALGDLAFRGAGAHGAGCAAGKPAGAASDLRHLRCRTDRYRRISPAAGGWWCATPARPCSIWTMNFCMTAFPSASLKAVIPERCLQPAQPSLYRAPTLADGTYRRSAARPAGPSQYRQQSRRDPHLRPRSAGRHGGQAADRRAERWPLRRVRAAARWARAGRQGHGAVQRHQPANTASWMPTAWRSSVIDEAVRNAVAVGADPERIALLDNFCWGDPKRPETLGSLVEAARGCHDAALLYRHALHLRQGFAQQRIPGRRRAAACHPAHPADLSAWA